jgi:hypothetical protein
VVDEKVEAKIRFRGGVRYMSDTKLWHIVIEVNGAQFLEEEGFETEEEAMVVYRAAREEIANSLANATGPDLEFKNALHCTLCKTGFTTFTDYDAHLPCPGEKAE